MYQARVADWEAQFVQKAAADLAREKGPTPQLTALEGAVDFMVTVPDAGEFKDQIRELVRTAVSDGGADGPKWLEVAFLEGDQSFRVLAGYPQNRPTAPPKRLSIPPPEGVDSAAVWLRDVPLLLVEIPVMYYEQRVGRLRGLFPTSPAPTPHPHEQLPLVISGMVAGPPLVMVLGVVLGGALLGGFRFMGNRVSGVSRRKREESPEGDELVPPQKNGQIGPYRIVKRLGHGGMASLYLVENVRENSFRKRLALKRIHPHLAEDREFIHRFFQEARVAALLEHPNVVRTWDFQKYDDSYVIVMEYVRGRNLAQILERLGGPLAVDQTVFMMLQIANGLDYSHGLADEETETPMEIVHRDVSPQNILVSFEGEVKVSDFGIARIGADAKITQAGAFIGKFQYASPEQLRGRKDVDHRSDLYSLGIIGYEMLSGRPLCQCKTFEEAIRFVEDTQIPALRDSVPEIPAELEAIVMKALQKDPAERYQSAGDMIEDLVQLRKTFSYMYGRSDLSRFMRKLF